MSSNTASPPTDPKTPEAAKSSAGSKTPESATAKQQQLPSAVEFEPPLACVRRILKHSLPSSTNVGKDASAAFARACGIFIIYLTACANDFARENKRQTITANDVMAAVKELDFEDFLPQMKDFLEAYRAVEKSKKDAKLAAAAKRAEEEKEEEEAKEGSPALQAAPNEEEDADVTTEKEIHDDNKAKPLVESKEEDEEGKRKRPRPEEEVTSSKRDDDDEKEADAAPDGDRKPAASEEPATKEEPSEDPAGKKARTADDEAET